jgi:hypothetical protein
MVILLWERVSDAGRRGEDAQAGSREGAKGAKSFVERAPDIDGVMEEGMFDPIRALVMEQAANGTFSRAAHGCRIGLGSRRVT